jgi:ParB-like chromosome segregation protein Spo0J
MSTALTAPADPSRVRQPQQPTLAHFLPPDFLPPEPDIRDRKAPSYRAFLDQLAADLKERGVQVPVLAYLDGERPRLIDGETRRQGLLLAGVNSPVPTLLYAEKPDASVEMVGKLQANAMRHDMTDLEYAAVYQQIMALNGWSAAELWRQLKVNPATGTKRLSISTRLCEQVRAMVAANAVCARAAYAISRLADIPVQIDLAERYRQSKICAEGVEAEVDRILNGGKRGMKQKPLHLKLEGIGFTAKKPTAEAIRTFLDRLSAALKKLKPGDDIGDLPFHFRSS